MSHPQVLMIPDWVNLSKEEGRTGFSEGWQGCSKGFTEGKARGKSRGAVLQPEENPVHPDSFTWIYILFYKY